MSVFRSGGYIRRHASLIAYPFAFLVVLVILWDIAVTEELVSDLILPRPGDMAVAFVELIGEGIIWGDFWATTYETVMGFLIGSAFGIALAIMSGLSSVLRKMLYPYIISLQVTPRIAIAPIIIAWFGFGYTAMIVIAALIAFFPVFVNTLTGMVAADEDAKEMFRSFGASRQQTFVHLLLPSALPVMFAGLKTAMTLALIGAIVGEFISAQEGLGLAIQRFSYQLQIDEAFAVLLILTLLGLVLYGAMVYLERIAVFWTHDKRLLARTRKRSMRAAKAER